MPWAFVAGAFVMPPKISQKMLCTYIQTQKMHTCIHTYVCMDIYIYFALLQRVLLPRNTLQKYGNNSRLINDEY